MKSSNNNYHNTFDGKFSRFVLTSGGRVTITDGGGARSRAARISDKMSSLSSSSRSLISSLTVPCPLQLHVLSNSSGGLFIVLYIATSSAVLPIKPETRSEDKVHI